MHNKRDWRLDTERERKEKEKSERKKDAKAKGRKNKVPKLNDKIPPNFDFIPISRVFSVKTKTETVGESDNRGSRSRYKRKPGDGGTLSCLLQSVVTDS